MMRLMEIAALNVKHETGHKESETETYFHNKEMIRQGIFASTLEDPMNSLRICQTAYDKYIRIIILLTEDYYNRHLGKLVKDAQRKEINRWLLEIAQRTAPKLMWLGRTGG